MRIRPFEPRDAEGILAVQRRYPAMWGISDGNDVHVDFDAKDNLMCFVAEEDDGTFLAAIGTIHRYEVWMTMDRKAHSPKVYIRLLQQLFVKIIYAMWEAGFNGGFATVPKPLKSWANMLVKRFKFNKITTADLFWFNAAREIDRVKQKS